jgi:hypothetical protein
MGFAFGVPLLLRNKGMVDSCMNSIKKHERKD